MTSEPTTLATDVAVFGSGPAGVAAAYALAESGLQVAMFDVANDGTVPPPAQSYMDMRTRDHSQWRTLLGSNFEALDNLNELSPKLKVPRLRYVFEGYSEWYRLQEDQAVVRGSLATGGLSNAWGAGVACYDGPDLENSPLDHSDLAESYDRVARRIGICGSNSDDLGSFFGAGLPLQPAPPIDDGISSILENYRRLPQVKKRFGVKMGRPRNAVITESRGQRRECAQCGQCVLGCARDSIYNSKFDLDELKKFSNFRFWPGIVAEDLSIGQANPTVLARRVIDKSSLRITARAIVLACGAVGSAALVRRALESYEPVRLFTNPVAVFALWMPGKFGSPVPQKFFGLSQASFSLSNSDGSYVFGNLYASHGLPISDFALRMPFGRSSSISLLRMIMPSVAIGMVWLHSKWSRNSFRITPDRRIVVCGGFDFGYRAELDGLRSRLSKMFRRYGAWMLPKSFTVAPPGADSHYAGTIPMRGEPGPCEADQDGQVRGLPAIYVVDGSALGAIPAKPHTLTIMANADRIASGLARRLAGS
jgi:choline dehydrogenase-like flavoprotein